MLGRLLAVVSLALAVSVAPGRWVAGPSGPPTSASRPEGRPMFDPPLAQAFAAVFGQSGSVKRVVSRTSRPPCCRTVTLTVTPGDLLDLGCAGRYALISLETDSLSPHADPGAISIAYLDHQGEFGASRQVWNEFAWTGDTGIPADTLQALAAFRAPPMVFCGAPGRVAGRTRSPRPGRLGSWSATGRAWPATSTPAVSSMRMTDAPFSICGSLGLRRPASTARSRRARCSASPMAAGAKPLASIVRTPFATVTNYVERRGTLVAVPPVSLPDPN